MDDQYERFLTETGLNKKIILFCSVKDGQFVKNMMIFMSELDICGSYVIHDNKSLVDVMCEKEKKRINDDEYIFYFLADSNVELLKSLKILTQNNIKNYRLFSYHDRDIIYRNYFKNYLINKGIDVSGPIIKIKYFVFDNLLSKEFYGIFNWGDLVLPTFFNDFSTIDKGPYEYAKAVIEKEDVVFDCGANIGSFSAFVLAKGCELHAFEPIVDTFEILKHNLRHYGESQKHINNVGLSNRKGLLDFYFNDSNDANYLNYRDYKEKKKCSVTTIDEYVDEHHIQKVDFIKADVEGAERDMLIGAIDTIKKYKPKISICTYHLEDDPKVIEEIIKSAYSKYNIVHKWNKCYAYV